MVELARVRTARPRLQLLAVDERGRSLVTDDDVGVSAPAWWRRTAVDGVADGGGWRRVGWRGCFGAHGVRMGKREVERKGEPCIQDVLVSNARKFTNLALVSNFLHHSNISRLGIGQ